MLVTIGIFVFPTNSKYSFAKVLLSLLMSLGPNNSSLAGPKLYPYNLGKSQPMVQEISATFKLTQMHSASKPNVLHHLCWRNPKHAFILSEFSSLSISQRSSVHHEPVLHFQGDTLYQHVAVAILPSYHQPLLHASSCNQPEELSGR